jgi:hypothetical protein
MKSIHFRFTHLALVLGFVASALHADTFTVTRTNATGPGSLPVVINQANAMPGDNVIEFAVTNPIVLVAPLPPITNNVTINGRIDVPTIISGGGAVPIFAFVAGTTNILSNLVLPNGFSTGSGAAINNAGVLFVSGCLLTNNVAPGSGGAISNGGVMTLVNTSLAWNRATQGGAIYNAGSMTISASPLAGNGAGNGGAIYNEGDLFLNQLTISSNRTSLGFGGGIYSDGSLTLLASTFAYNQAVGGSGGYAGIVGGGGGAGLGGALFSAGGVVLATNSTFFGNSAIGGEGGGYQFSQTAYSGGGNNAGAAGSSASDGGLGGGGAGGYPGGPGPGNGGFGGGGGGGGYFVQGVFAAPGLGGFGGGNGANDSLYGTGPGGGGAGMGGGVFLEAGGLTAVNCTIAGNLVAGGLPGAPWTVGPNGTAGQGIGGGMFNHSGTVTLLNTILASNVATNNPQFGPGFTVAGNPNTSPDMQGAVVSTGFNLVGNNQSATGLSINDFQNVPANLGPLQDNGGPTLTCALLQGSLAIGAGTSTGAPLTDQRGVARPPGQCDIGAFQLATLITPTVQWTNPSDIVYGTPLGSSQLNATAGAAGTLVYTPPGGTVLAAGSNQMLQVVFTPADPSQYTSATNSVLINVLKADQTITFAAISGHRIGDPPILLSASANSGLPVSLAVISSPATLTGNLLSFGSTNGWVTVAATQLGDTSYNGVELDQSFYLGTFPLPVITTQPASQSVYPGDRVSFSVAATNGPLSYQWEFFGESIAGGTSSSLVLARVQASQAGPYRVILSNPSGSVTSAIANLGVVVSAGTPAITVQPQGQAIRLGETATLHVVATGAAPLSYQWYEGVSGDTNGIVPGAISPVYTASGLTTNTSFWVSVNDNLGTVDSAAANVAVFPAKAARLRLTMQNGMAALVIDGLPGTQYRLDYTTNLSATAWSNVVNLVLPSSPYTFIDATSLNAPLRFYRAVTQ